MKHYFLVITFLFCLLSFGQTNVEYDLIDKKVATIPLTSKTSINTIAKYINANFKTENDKIRAVFYWTASNISYDVKNMFAVNTNETPQERIEKTLKTKKGICADYSLIFNEIATSVGVKSVIVEGYTKQNGKIDTLSHAWCAAKIDNKWYIFDPTWGSGSLVDGMFVKKINNYYFKTEPEKIISSHIPFDYLWQFIDYPITNQEFIEGVFAGDETKVKFDFITEIDKYESLSKANQYFESSQRIQKNEIKNQLISQAYADAINHWNYEKDRENNSKTIAIVKQFNEAIKELNDFIHYRNNQFIPILSDDQIKAKIQIPNDKLKKCQQDILLIEPFKDANANNNLDNLKKAIEETLVNSESHLEFVNNYLSKSELVRKTMFTIKYSPESP
jgi:hypothetical protein